MNSFSFAAAPTVKVDTLEKYEACLKLYEEHVARMFKKYPGAFNASPAIPAAPTLPDDSKPVAASPVEYGEAVREWMAREEQAGRVLDRFRRSVSEKERGLTAEQAARERLDAPVDDKREEQPAPRPAIDIEGLH